MPTLSGQQMASPPSHVIIGSTSGDDGDGDGDDDGYGYGSGFLGFVADATAAKTTSEMMVEIRMARLITEA